MLHEDEGISPKDNRSNSLISLIAGSGAGVLCSILCAPLDVAKVRMQVQGSLKLKKYSTTSHTVMLIYKEEGIRGCFRGLGPTLLVVPLFWGIYWCAYETLKDKLAANFPKSPPSYIHLSSAVCAGVLGDVITNPFWVVRTRIQTLALHTHVSSISSVNMFKTIYQTEGMKAFYKGLSASFLGLSHVAIQFPLYEYLKTQAQIYRQNSNESREYVRALDIVCASLSAKLVASLISYPHEVLRARLQDGRAKEVGILQTINRIIINEGFFNLWAGYRVNLARIFPATLSTFLTYEYISRYLKENSTFAQGRAKE